MRWPVALVAFLALAGCGSSSLLSPSSVVTVESTPATIAPVATTSAPATVPATIAIIVTGSTATADVTIDIGSASGSSNNEHPAERLPYSVQITGLPYSISVAASVTSTGTLGNVQCEIDLPGQPPIKNSSSGQDFSIVTCTT